MITALLNFAISLFMSLTLIPVFMKYAANLGLLDQPDGKRKIHSSPIPKTGGLAIAVASILPIIYISTELTELLPLLAGSVIIIIFGFLDDIYDLKTWKFLGQFVAVAVFLGFTPGIAEKNLFLLDSIPVFLNYLILFFFLLGATNAINLSDGLDGLAAGLTLISLILIAFLASESGVTSILFASLALIGALMGFLRYNTHPAKVFMGDTGSQFIGFATASLALYTTQHAESAVSPVLPILITGLPVMDTLMVMALRIRAGKPPFSADKNHIHHQLIKSGFYHYEAVAILYILQVSLVAVAYLFRFESDGLLIFIYLCFSGSIFFALYFTRFKSEFLKHRSTTDTFIERRNPIFRRFNWVYIFSSDIITLFVCLCWIILLYFTAEFNLSVAILALLALLIPLVIKYLLPAYKSLRTRILAYSSTVLTLYSFNISQIDGYGPEILNFTLVVVGLFLILSIRMTRREQFHLNNQDILILFILLLGPLLPLESEDGINAGIMLFRIAVMIYAIEYLISKSSDRQLLLRSFSSFTLLAILISQF